MLGNMDDDLRAIVREMDSLQDELARVGHRHDELAVAGRRRIARRREAAARRLFALGRNAGDASLEPRARGLKAHPVASRSSRGGSPSAPTTRKVRPCSPNESLD
jgi:hypothetical protein